MSESEEVFTIFKRYWKILLKWIFRIHGLPEITVDDLFTRLKSEQPPVLIDIRSVDDYNGVGYSKYGHIPNALSIPILELESHLEDLVSYKEKEIVTMCPGGGLSLAAVEILVNTGFKDVKSLKGGTDLWNKKGYPTTRKSMDSIKTDTLPPSLHITTRESDKVMTKTIEVTRTLDARGLSCPEPILRSGRVLKELNINQVLEILTTDPGSVSDIPTWARVTGQELIVYEERGSSEFRFLVKKLK